MAQSSAGLLISLVIGIVIFVALILLFELFRKMFPRIFSLRELLSTYDDVKTNNGKPIWYPPYQVPKYPMGWAVAAYQIKEYEIAKHISVDAAVFLRFLRSQSTLFFVLTIITFAILAPTYATGTNKNLEVTDPSFVNGVLVMSMSNLPRADGRLWVTWLAEIAIMGIIYVFYYTDFKRYTFYAKKYFASRAPQNFSVLILDIPENFRSTEQVYALFDRIFPGEVAYAKFIENAPELVKIKNQYLTALTKKEKAMYQTAHGKTPGMHPTIKPKDPEAGMCGPKLPETSAVEYWYTQEGELWSDVAEKQSSGEGLVPTRAAIVMFLNIHTASQAAQTQIWLTPDEFVVERAPEQEALNWPKLKVPRFLDFPMKVVVFIIVILICLFWSAISLAVSALGNLSALSQVSGFSWLEPVLDLPEVVLNFIEGFLPPLLLIVMSKLPPIIFKILVSLCRYPWIAAMEATVRDYWFMFLFFTNFVFILVSGSVLSQLQALIDNPTSILDILATSIPAQSLFFLNYVLQNSFIGFPVLLTQLPRVFLRVLIAMITRPKTEREMRKLDRGPGVIFLYPKFYALSLLVSLVSIVYSSITPLINLFAAVYFAIAYFVCKYNIAYTHYHLWQAGGLLYKGCFAALMVNLFTKQIAMVGLFSVFKAPAQAALEAVFLLSSIFVSILIQRRYARLSRHGSLMTVFDSYGKTIDEDDQIPRRYLGTYVHPGLKPLPTPKDLSGLTEEELQKYDLARFTISNTGEDLEKAMPSSEAKEDETEMETPAEVELEVPVKAHTES
mmetsp:Transcript_8979/g.16174  ORF Transcript_8979/g.16174 Transcript_8979/m.16174 type:complete len:785 (-) Transcript_8979:46-2400(-)